MEDPATTTDPSALTTNQLLREVQHLRELLEAKLGAIEKEHTVFADSLQRLPTTLDREMTRMTQLTAQQFATIDQRVAAVHEAGLTRHAANNTAVEKSEHSVTTRIDQLNTMTQSRTDSLREQISAMSSRLDRGEGRTNGQSDQIGRLLGVAALAVSIVVGGVAVMRANVASPAVVVTPR